MSQDQPVQPHQQDDCDDCKKQRAQNNQLIDFYQRVNKLKTKVIQIKPQIANHASASKDQRTKLQKISNKMVFNPNLISQVNNIDSKEMGYQLTCALLQRELKIKKENQRLSRRIRQLKTINENTQQTIRKSSSKKRDCQMQSEPQDQTFNSSKLFINNESVKLTSSKMKESKSVFSDSLDNALEDNNKSFWGTYQMPPLRSQRTREQNSRYSQAFGVKDNQKDQSTFSSFDDTGRTIFNQNQQNSRKKYQNINLWLYQVNTQQQYPVKNRIKDRLTKKK